MAQIINNHTKKFPRKQKYTKDTPIVSNKVDLKCQTIQELYQLATKQYIHHKNEYSKQDSRWNQMFAKAGTKKDKITAVASAIIQAPSRCLQSFQMLLQWCMDENASFALTAAQALADIFTEHIFSEKPSLKIFVDSIQQYIKAHKKNCLIEKIGLVGFYLQHKIKHYYGQFIRSLQQILDKNILHAKKAAINILVRLSKFQELRRNTISIIVNKFGESQKQIVNQVSKSLKNQFYQDLTSSAILLQEAQAFLFRKNLRVNTQFYVINFLNSLNLKFLNETSLGKLFEIFYYFFNKMIDKQSEESYCSRLFLNSVKGLNKIMSFLKSGSKQTRNMIQQKTEAVYKIVHTTTNTKAKVQLLLFLFQSHSHLSGSLPDRYYRVLYDFLSHGDILNCSLAEVFFDLLLISIKQDQNLNRIIAFLKRILQLCFKAPVNFIVTCLIMVSKVVQENQALKIAISRKQNWLNQELKDEEVDTKQSQKYDMFKRQPIFCGAQKTCLWELRAFLNHFHPTVRKYTEQILKGQNIQYDGTNPLIQFNITSFIQKLSLKKQKKSESWRIKMKKNLPKIRSTKYESMLQKPLQTYRQDEQFIKKYLLKRKVIHRNSQKMRRPTDIEDFADDLMEREMNRLNPDKDEDLSFSDDIDLQQQDQQMDFDEGQVGSQNQRSNQGQQEQQELQGQDGFDEDVDQQGQFNQQIGFDEMHGGDQSMDDQEQDSLSADRQFEDAFDEVGQEEQKFARKRGKKITKVNKGKPIKGRPAKGKKDGKKRKFK